MRAALGVTMLVAAGCGSRPLDVGEYVDLGDVLEVHVVDDRPYVGTGAPIEGARVVADDSRGRHEALSDPEGRARVTGLDFAADPPDLTVSADGFPVLTVTSLGSTGPVPTPLEVALGALDFCWICFYLAPESRGDIVGRHAPGSTVVASLPGAWAASVNESWLVNRLPALSGDLPLTGIEVSDRVVVGYDVATLAEGAPAPGFDFSGEVTTAAVEVATESKIAPESPVSGAPATVLVVDENEQGRMTAVLGFDSVAPGGSLTVSYADEARGELAVYAEVAPLFLYSLARAPIGGGEPVELRLEDVPGLAGEAPVIPRDPLEVVGGDDSAVTTRAVVLVDTDVLWVVLLAPGDASARLPFAPPTALSGELVIAAPTLFVWDADPWEDYGVLGPRWAGPHRRAMAIDGLTPAEIE